jgi:voltage-gated potassium channel
MHHSLYIFFLRLHPLIRIFTIAVSFITFFGIVIHYLEPGNFRTIFDGIWWAIITASTVGYGDYVPQTFTGRIVGIVLLFLGAGFISAYFFNLATAAITKQNQLAEGRLTFHGRGHMIIIGWNERSKIIINNLIQNGSCTGVVLIDETLKESPVFDKRVHFIQGRATTDEVLIKANIEAANKVLITADQDKGEYLADMNSILTLIAVKGVCPDIFCIVEILTSDQVTNAKRAGANSIIESNQIISTQMVQMTLEKL